MNNFAPVAVFAYTREDHLKITLEALAKSPIANETDIIIFCDNYKKEKDKAKVQAVRDFVDHFAESSPFKKTVVHKAEKNKGLRVSIVEGVTSLMKEYGRVIVVEDDLDTSPHFLQYMNDALDYYSDNEKIWAISGYSFPMKSLENYKDDVFFTGRGCSWGWASWKNRWEMIDWNVSDYESFKNNRKRRKAFAEWGADLPTMLDGQMISDIDSWAVIWCYEAFRHDMLTVYPKTSFLKNLGNDGSGTHNSDAEDEYATVVNLEKEYKCSFVDPYIDSKIKKEFARKYTGDTVRVIKRSIKSILRRKGLYNIFFK